MFCCFLLMCENFSYEVRCSPITSFSQMSLFKKSNYCSPGRNDDKPAQRISSITIKFVVIDKRE